MGNQERAATLALPFHTHTCTPPPHTHPGDSVTVAPAQTLTDKEYQRLRDAAIAIIREMGVECGGSNVQVRSRPLPHRLVETCRTLGLVGRTPASHSA